MNIEHLYGIYEIVSIEAFKPDGSLTTERAKSGMFVFTRDHKLSVVSGANEWVMASRMEIFKVSIRPNFIYLLEQESS